MRMRRFNLIAMMMIRQRGTGIKSDLVVFIVKLQFISFNVDIYIFMPPRSFFLQKGTILAKGPTVH